MTSDVSAAGSVSSSPATDVEVCAPPELLTVTSGLVLPGADTVVDVSEAEVVEVSAAVSVAVSEVCAPPELLTVLVGADVSSEVEVPVDEVSDSVALVDVEESESVGSADAIAGC